MYAEFHRGGPDMTPYEAWLMGVSMVFAIAACLALAGWIYGGL
jgi:hypothetical protein